MNNTFEVKQPDGSVKHYRAELEIYADQAYANHLEDGGELTYAEFCDERFMEINPHGKLESSI